MGPGESADHPSDCVGRGGAAPTLSETRQLGGRRPLRCVSSSALCLLPNPLGLRPVAFVDHERRTEVLAVVHCYEQADQPRVKPLLSAGSLA